MPRRSGGQAAALSADIFIIERCGVDSRVISWELRMKKGSCFNAML